MYKCNVCKKEYSSISSLNHHQKTATFCIKLQTKNKESNNIENSEHKIMKMKIIIKMKII
jgi:hypothetical protein